MLPNLYKVCHWVFEFPILPLGLRKNFPMYDLSHLLNGFINTVNQPYDTLLREHNFQPFHFAF